MPDNIKINQETDEPAIDIALDTIRIGKQAIIFVNTKRSAESVAEKIALRLKKANNYDAKTGSELAEKVLHALPSPTKQCRRLAETIRYGIAFHHAGLASEQKTTIEDSFRAGSVKIIVATPTLAIGVDLPAFRVIIRDLKRYGLWGLEYIPVLEYEQQAGRAGRPSYDQYGEAIATSDKQSVKNEIYDKYILGEPEEIVSKLAVEPIMRTYILSLIASGFVTSTIELNDFFASTFYAQQYGDTRKLFAIIDRMLEQLEEWDFIKIERKDEDDRQEGGSKGKKISMDFVSALKMSFSSKKLEATLLGRRVSELYIDPYTANFMIACMRKALAANIPEGNFDAFSLVHMTCSCLELRPLLRTKNADLPDLTEFINKNQIKIISQVPELFEEEYDEFLDSTKTAKFFMEWLDEKDEEYLLERYDVRPGETASKKETADWLLYASEELAKLMKMHPLIKEVAKLRFRLKYGAREELIPLLQLKNIGRVRARALYQNRIKDVGDVKKADLGTLTRILGKAIALDVKKQVGEDLSEDAVKVKEGKRKGQINLGDYDGE